MSDLEKKLVESGSDESQIELKDLSHAPLSAREAVYVFCQTNPLGCLPIIVGVGSMAAALANGFYPGAVALTTMALTGLYLANPENEIDYLKLTDSEEKQRVS